ncbi:MAG TPA: ABC transporter permease [Flavobacteriaceae bacterium]|nr:ABC transporter permease [Flavobacteriaceae bacterium]HPF12456.1 ABC transporter permease [Flavobacteriaceae bacterium]HQU22632.1 ABC transporter permease [Flavobacteriaceae bacterium]HQU66214.1 ABC transporter permease [Flavobacteriaceae bacterium]
MTPHPKEEWLYEISAKRKLINLNFKEIWHYRDLLFLFVKRDIVTVYKQTILGPFWYLIQPLFTSVVFTLIFNNLGNIQTGGVPPFLFNLAGITAWNYFKECLTKTSTTFTSNQQIFGKVYFPRVVMPLSVTISNLLKFGIQLVIFICFYCYYLFKGYELAPNGNLWLFPAYIIMMALLGLGAGMVVSSLTTKYRDLNILLSFAVQLLMYLSAVPYPLAEATKKFPPFVTNFITYNPMSQIIEGFRYLLLDSGSFSWLGFTYTLLFCLVLFFVGIIVFNRTEKTFIDTV